MLCFGNYLNLIQLFSGTRLPHFKVGSEVHHCALVMSPEPQPMFVVMFIYLILVSLLL